AEAKPAESAKVDGKAVFEANCKACHSGLIPGAPAVGKKEDWAPRIKQGKDTLHKHAIEGFQAMPAKGGNGSLSDDEVKAAVDYMANESGAKF
ncbi:MAG: c-type cytochrome, partial [Neisseria sp.]